MKASRTLLALSFAGLMASAMATMHVLKVADAGGETPRGRLIPLDRSESHLRPVQRHAPKASAVSSSCLLYEDFEGVSGRDPYPLPEGWTTIPNPQRPEDKWMAGTLYSSDGQFMGESGEKYAFLLGDMKHGHDTWMYSPAVSLEKGETYKVQQSVVMHAGSDYERLDIAICRATDGTQESVVQNLVNIYDDIQHWQKIIGHFTPEESGEYYIGYHSTSNADTSGILVDDVAVVNIMSPVYYSANAILFPSKYPVHGEQRVTFTISNDGYVPLEVDLKECSPEIRVTGLPLTIDAEETEAIKVFLDAKEPGVYTGYIKLATNDPLSPEVTLAVVQEVKEAAVGDAKMHNFDDGTPKSYRNSISLGGGNVIGVGKDGSRAFYTSTMFCGLNPDGLVDLYTDFVDLGEAPHLKFSYSLHGEDELGRDTNQPVDSETPRIMVYLTDDYDVTWHSVYEMKPGAENVHDGKKGFHNIDVDLSQFAGKFCRARIGVGHASESAMDYATKHFAVEIDNVMLGTPFEKDMALKTLQGTTILTEGETGSYRIVAENLGAEGVKSYEIVVTDEKENRVATFNSPSIRANSIEEYTFKWTPSEKGMHILNAVVNVEGDADMSDNRALPLHVNVLDKNNYSQNLCTENKDSVVWAASEPINFYETSSRHASIYYANEIGVNRGRINSLVYDVRGADYKSDSFKVYVTETDVFELDPGMDLRPESMTLVFDGRIHFPDGQSKMVIPFETPYEYGGGNLVVVTERFGEDYVYGRDGKLSMCTETRALESYDPFETKKDYTELPVPSGKPRYAAMTINIDCVATGALTGTVKDDKGNALKDVKIYIEGESMNATTRGTGAFTFRRLGTGVYKVRFCLPGYDEQTQEVTIEEGGTTRLDIVLSEMTKQKVTGIVKDSEGNPVKGAHVMLAGPVEVAMTSDAEGLFEGEVYSNSDYSIAVTQPYFTDLRGRFRVEDKGMSLTVTVGAKTTAPDAVKAVSLENDDVKIEWSDPLVELRHDSGDMVSALGLAYGGTEAIFGVVYREKAIVKEINWYMTDDRAHDSFYAYVLGLKDDGTPDPGNVLYSSVISEWQDNDWNTHKLTTPVEADGFMVAIACNGYLGVGATRVTDNYPKIDGTEFYSDLTFRTYLAESNLNYHYMIRAGVELKNANKDVTRPEISNYRVYRFNNNDETWDRIGTVSEQSFLDNVASLPEGRYRWAVEAEYPTGISPKARTERIYLTPSAVGSLGASDFGLTWDGASRSLKIDGAENVKSVTIYDAAGKGVETIRTIDTTVNLSGLKAGVYVVAALLKDNSVEIKKINL